MKESGFFDLKFRFRDITRKGDPLQKLNNVINWEYFRDFLEQAIQRKDRAKGGRPAYDHILMFKILVVQSLFNLSDDQTEYQIKDRLSFMRFLNLSLYDTVPDAKTIWLFREKLSKNNGIKKLFNELDRMLVESGFTARSGQIIDASIIKAPKRRNISKTDKELIKIKKIPRNWSENKKRQTDVNAGWTFKGDVPYFGYKNHINIDKKYRFIRKWKVTSSSVHDSRIFKSLYDFSNYGIPFYADAAYRSKKIESFLRSQGKISKIQWKKPPKKKLDPCKKTLNRLGSKIRGVVEHVFAKQKMHMNLFIRTVGIERAETKIGLANLVYNFTRLEFLKRKTTV